MIGCSRAKQARWDQSERALLCELRYCTVVQPWTWTKLGKVSCVLRQREIDGILFELVRECFGVAPVCVHWLPPTEVAGE